MASEELSRNRGIDIVPILSNIWWRGVLYMYAIENSVDQLIEQSYEIYGNVDLVADNLRNMFSVRPETERVELNNILDSYFELGELNYSDSKFD